MKHRHSLLLSLTFWTAISSTLQAQEGNYPPDPPEKCMNKTKSDCDPCCETAGTNKFTVNGLNVMRDITDLEIWGGVGEHRLAWTRHARSRRETPTTLFGKSHNWRHSYQWDFVASGSNEMEITTPGGARWRFTYADGIWNPESNSTDILDQSGTTFYLTRSSGWVYRFDQFFYGGGTIYRMTSFSDSISNTYTLTYDSQYKLTRVTEPAGRYLEIGYTGVATNENAYTTIASVGPNNPADDWNEITVTDTNTYRYLRYTGNDWNWSLIAEVEFYDMNNQKLTGTQFGNVGQTPHPVSNAFDGDVSTYYKYLWPQQGFAGIDLGAGNEKRISKVRYRPCQDLFGTGHNFTKNALFQGSNTATVTTTVIGNVTASDGRAVNYSYQATADPYLPEHNWVGLTGASYGDSTQAAYSYTNVWGGYSPLMTEANDPRYRGSGRHIKYEYWESTLVFGMLKLERNPVNNQILVQNGPGATDEVAILYPNSRQKLYTATSAALDRVTQKKDELGNTTNLQYAQDGAGLLISETDPLNRTSSYTYDALGNYLSMTNPDGTVRRWTRDARGRVLTETDELGRITRNTRDGKGRVTRRVYPDGSFESWTYNDHGQVLTHQMRNGGGEINAYNSIGNRTSHTDSLGKVTSFGYTAAGLVNSVTDARNHTTGFLYFERGTLEKTTYHDGKFTSATYDNYGNQLTSTNEIGKTWHSTYDVFNRQLTQKDPLNRTTVYNYDEVPGGGGCCGGGGGGSSSHLIDITLPSGKKTHFDYDLAWRKTGETVGYGTADAATTFYGYNAAGELVTVTDPRGKIWTSEYNNRGWKKADIDPLGNRTEYGFDTVGNQQTVKRPDGGVTRSIYDAMNRVVQTTDPKGQSTYFYFGGTGYQNGSRGDNLVRLKDAKGNITDFTYDLMNRKTSMIYPQ